MKTHLITVKLSEDEYNKLKHNVELENTTVSQCIRECINEREPINGRDVQTAVTKICEIYIELTKIKSDNNESIMEGMDRLCQKLY